VRSWISLAFVWSACSLYTGEPIGDAVTSHVEYKDLPVAPVRRADLLFVIDDSPAMAPHQATLLANLRLVPNVLTTVAGGAMRWHVGVITGDLGTLGGPARSACRGDGDGGLLRRTDAVDDAFLDEESTPDGTPVRNYRGTFADAFVQLADVGTRGCAYQQPLAAAVRALTDPRNAGFRRATADLVVMFISAQDDCSFADASVLERDPDLAPLDTSRCARHAHDGGLRSTELLATTLKVLGELGAPGRAVVVAGVFGPGHEPACSYDGASAQPGDRLAGLLGAFPNRSTFTTICQGDYSDALQWYSDFGPQLGSPCLDTPVLDTDPIAPGVQADCTVSDVQHAASADRTEQVLPPCEATMATTPCWQIVEDPQNCDGATHQALVVQRGSADAPEDDRVIAECVTK